MALANFTFNGIKTAIQCVKEDKIKDICAKYASKIDKDLNSLYFSYNGNQINNELTFYEQANSLDKQSLEMNILVIPNKDSNELKSQIESTNINEIETIENKKEISKHLINEMSVGNEKTKNEIQNILNIKNDIILKDEKKLYNSLENNYDNLYDNFDIKSKNPSLKLKAHKKAITCATVLNDGRFATCSDDGSIIIYNDKTSKPDLVIQEHNDWVNYILQLSTGMLASCSSDKSIKIFNIKYNNYQLLQTLNYHNSYVYKIIELNNRKLISCSDDSSVIIYSKDNNNKYTKDYKITTDGTRCFCVIQTKENEICYDERHSYDNHSICFYDLLGQNVIKKINNLGWIGWNSFNMISEDLLLITGEDKLYIINVNQYNLIRIINAPGSSYIYVSCILNKSIFLTADYNKNIRQWRIEGNDLELVSTKENAHDKFISTVTNLHLSQ